MIYTNYYMGSYIIEEQRLGNFSRNGIYYCNNCLWINFYEGCNKYKEYFFETQHDFDERLKVGMPVNIKFNNNGFITNINKAVKYKNKC